MATLKERLMQEKHDFEQVLRGEKLTLMNVQAKFIQDAIPSIDYMLKLLNGEVILPKEDEDMDTSLGKVFAWMQGSLINITMAETLVYGNWKNVTECFKCMYMSLADEVNKAEEEEDDWYGDDDWEFGTETKANSQSGLADEVNNNGYWYGDEDWEYGTDNYDYGADHKADSQSGLADEVNNNGNWYGDEDWEYGTDNYDYGADPKANSQSGLADEVNNNGNWYGDEDWEYGTDNYDYGAAPKANSQSGLADEVNKAEDDNNDDDYYCHYVGERMHSYLCDCLDIPDVCRDC